MPSGYMILVQEVILLAQMDATKKCSRRGPSYEAKEEALHFLQTEWFEMLCMSIDLDPHAVREAIIARNDDVAGRHNSCLSRA
ncbi:hypothetical protein [Paenibacillus spongiae]|uniref:Sin domain-containing protein n=1 Tax=Paenibacillus spongiae TaxID=2909671 RepID=A0ABY5SEG0_9BACL|nr:hypothetical protein [Paenibacillus spongiae]UVI31152.1 hypothetical protein L1F29_04715 [Paenibacillus spongiae]